MEVPDMAALDPGGLDLEAGGRGSDGVGEEVDGGWTPNDGLILLLFLYFLQQAALVFGFTFCGQVIFSLRSCGGICSRL